MFGAVVCNHVDIVQSQGFGLQRSQLVSCVTSGVRNAQNTSERHTPPGERPLQGGVQPEGVQAVAGSGSCYGY